MKAYFNIRQVLKVFLIVFFTISIGNITAQVEKDTVLAFQYYKKADSLLKAKQHVASVSLFKKALPIYEKNKAWKKVAKCYNKISENQWRDRKLEQSLKNSKKALTVSDKYLTKDNQEEATAYDNIGTYYEYSADYGEAKNYYQKALEIRKKIFPEIHQDIATSYNSLGLIKNSTLDFKSAIQYFKKAIHINKNIFGIESEDVAWNYNNLGVTYRRLGKFEKALQYHKKSLMIRIKIHEENHITTGYSYVNIGAVYFDLIQYEKTLYYFQKAIPFFTKNNSKVELFKTYANTGAVFFATGSYDMALQYHKKSLDIGLKIFGKNHPMITKVYINIGATSLFKNNTTKALEYYKKALAININTYGKSHFENGDIYSNMAEVYSENKDYNRALEYHKKSLDIHTSQLTKNNLEIIRQYLAISSSYTKKGLHEDALLYCQKGLKLLQTFSNKQLSFTSESYNYIASIYVDLKRYKEAMIYFDKVLQVNIKNEDFLGAKNTFDPNHYFDNKLVLGVLKGKAKAFQSLYDKDKDVKYLDQSIAIYKNIELLINAIRISHQNYKDKVYFAEQTKEIYADAVKAYLLLYRETKQQQFLFEAFYCAEKSKANTLKELLADTDAKSIAGLPVGLTEMEKKLKTNRAFYQSKIIEQLSHTTTDSTKIKEYENELFAVNRKQDSLTQVLEKNYPKYHQLKYNSNIAKISEIQKKLNDQTSLLEFFTADSTTYAFTITKNNIAVQELSTPKLTEQVEAFRKSITSRDLIAYKKQAYQLYTNLIAPISNNLIGDELIIIPDGPLWHLNFELLLSKDDTSNNPKDLSYVLKDYAITYANSANLLYNSFKSDQSSKKQQECLAFSFSDSTSITNTKTMSLATLRDIGDDLPGTRKEIRAISDIIDGQYYFGSEAAEGNFKKNASKYTILHLALHGEVDHERPENSKLYFTKSKDTIEDGLLYSHELFALDIPAELTVLSACNTGSGKIEKGEGIMSLGNAFQYAGTKSLLLTSWEVSDQTTPELMKYFYTNLKAGMNKGKALQQAKLKYLRTANINRTNPFYWGGFYLVGDASPIHFSNNTIIYWVIGLSIVVILLFILFWYKRKVTVQ